MIALALVLGCRGEVCSTDPATLPVSRGDDAEAAALDAVWQTFAAAIAPAELCVTAVEVWSVPEWRVEGRYRSVRRNIWVQRDEPTEMATALRHELCHAYDQQVLPGRAPPDAFWIDVKLQGRHPGKIASREAFAWTCSLEPTLVPALAAATCDDDVGAAPLGFVADEVYAAEAPPIAVDRIEAPLELDRPVLGVEALVEVGGAIGVLLDDGTDATDLVWLDLAAGTAGRDAPDGPVELLTLAPPGSEPPAGSLALAWRTAASARTEVALVEVALLSGYAQRLIVRRDGGPWGAAPEACGLPLDARTSFFLLGDDRALTSVSAVDDRLVLIGWDGPIDP